MYILSIDQGTTGTTVVLVCAKSFSILDKVNKEHKQYFCFFLFDLEKLKKKHIEPYFR